MTGRFITLEGPEGSGKSTQARLLAELLRGLGETVVVTREPGGTAIGEQIRDVLLDQGNCAMLAQTEALLLTAARAQHVGEVIRPALSTGAVVVCDRFLDSTLAYQGGGHGLPMDQLLAIQELATNGLRPDLRLLFDLPVDVGLARRLQAKDGVNRIDRAATEFHERVRAAFLELARAEPDGWVIIDASKAIVDVANQVRDAVTNRLQLPVIDETP
ncbi:MAG TPA: dTMP kinase [Thermomicrobiales bacterium]|nr:dTMP kinase [Thermomicrobiales bacterium]